MIISFSRMTLLHGVSYNTNARSLDFNCIGSDTSNVRIIVNDDMDVSEGNRCLFQTATPTSAFRDRGELRKLLSGERISGPRVQTRTSRIKRGRASDSGNGFEQEDWKFYRRKATFMSSPCP
jgi:hypothetical protein